MIRLTLLLNPSATLDGSVSFAGCPSKIHAFAAVAEAEKRISSKRLALARGILIESTVRQPALIVVNSSTASITHCVIVAHADKPSRTVSNQRSRIKIGRGEIKWRIPLTEEPYQLARISRGFG